MHDGRHDGNGGGRGRGAAKGGRGPGQAPRTTYLDKLRRGEAEINNPRDAEQLFRQLLKRASTPEDLALTCDTALLPSLKQALAVTCGPGASLAQPLALLAALGAERLSHGVYASRVRATFQAFHEAPDFLKAVKDALLGSTLEDPAAVAWMLIKLAPESEAVRQCKDPDVRDVVELLKQSTAPGMNALAPRLATLFASVCAPPSGNAEASGLIIPSGAGLDAAPESLQAAKSAMRPPGVRDHDNDPEDFRSISIVPTPSELNCPEPPYLPHPEGSDFIADREAGLLDRQFRLMREDLVGSLRDELKEELEGGASDYRRLYRAPALMGLECPPREGPYVRVSVPLPPRLARRVRGMSPAEAREFFHNGPGRRVLGMDTLVVLMEPDKAAEGPGSDGDASVTAQQQQQQQQQQQRGQKQARLCLKAVAVAVVVARRGKDWSIADPEEAAGSGGGQQQTRKQHPEIRQLQAGVSFVGGSSLLLVSERLRGLQYKRRAPVLSSFLFNANAAFFTYEPVLRSLQLMPGVPLGDSLAQLRPPGTPELPHGARALADFSEEIQSAVASDGTQAEALELMCSSRVVLVQGPPGTGKTYVGVQMVKAMLEAQQQAQKALEAARPQRLRILCLCFSNHALDSFLESLMDAGIPDTQFVRLGTSPKISERIRKRCLRELPESAFDQQESRGYGQLMSEKEELLELLDELRFQLEQRDRWGTSVSWWEETVAEFLEDEHYEELLQLRVPPPGEREDDPLAVAPARDGEAEPWPGFRSGFTTAGAGNKAIQSNYLWERWCRGQNRGAFQTRSALGIWALDPEQRKKRRELWNLEWLQQFNEQMATVMQDLDRNARALQDLRLGSQSRVLKEHSIIGCTTVGAAKMRGMLREVAPDVVLVEEAGEILEAQVLSTVTEQCKQLILIGDHQQLRPKVECHRLRKESGSGVDLDVSLFERLVTTQRDGEPLLPTVTLQVQHRMRPEISELVRQTMYPDLLDHESTKNRPGVPGVARPVLFVTHSHPEKQDQEAADLGSKSKVNPYEVEMVVRTATHLLHQQGCSSDMITILTPYLGQLAEIRKRLKELKVGVSLNDRDVGDLLALNLMEDGAGNGGDQPERVVRASTVDNYQGEESPIILISLVRSNAQGDIGFLSSPQRVNVLLSRARNGMYIFGNMDCLTNARSSRGRDLWRRIKGLLEAKRQLLDFLPIVCSRHQTLAKVREPADFSRLSPHGGCTLPCGGELPCGHECPLPCHPGGAAVHARVQCRCPVPDVCSYGHPIQRECGQTTVVRCKKPVRWRCQEGHLLSGPCWKGRATRCYVCDILAEKEAAAQAKEEARQKDIVRQEAKLAELRAQVAAQQSAEADERELGRLKAEMALCSGQLSGRAPAIGGNRPPPPAPVPVLTPPPPIADALVAAQGEAPLPADADADAAVDAVLRDCPLSASGEEESSGVVVPDPGPARPRTAMPAEVDAKSGRQGAPQQSPPPPHTPPAPPLLQQPQEGSLEAELASVLEVYRSKGALAADNVLDGIVAASVEHQALAAIRYIIATELDPRGKADYREMEGAGGSGPAVTLGAAVCRMASFLALRAHFPLLARQHAERLLDFDAGHPGELPEAWVELAGKATQEVEAMAARGSTPGSFASGPPPSAGPAGDHRAQWAEILREDPKAPAVMAEAVLGMTGLEEVKGCMVGQYHRIKLAQKQGDGAASSYNARFEGNPGTGKTTVARHYGTFLQQLEVLPEGALFVETSGAALVHKGVQHLEEKLEEAKEAGGAVVFVDEAYQLVSDRAGRQVLDFILPLAEGLKSSYGSLVWVFAGYTKDMERLFEHNLGLPSRFPLRFKFQDYSDAQLLQIFKGLMETMPPGSSAGGEAGNSAAAKTGKSKSRPDGRAGSSRGRLPAPQSYGYGRAPRHWRVGETQKDRFGNTWTWSGSSWKDNYNNTVGYSPQDRLATASNPVVDADGKHWTHDGARWCSDSGDMQDHLPGSPAPRQQASPAPQQRPTPFTCHSQADKKALRVAVRRLGRRRGQPGFGNARAVRIMFDQVRGRQAERIIADQRKGSQPDIFAFTQADLLGLPPTAARLRKTAAYQKLAKLEGLQPVKDEVELLLRLVEKNWERELREEEPLDVVLNRVFLGNPGTGKTTVAALYGSLLAEMGLLSKGEMVLKNPSDFVGDVLGSSEKQTRDILRAAEGCVLVIDEAYGLYSGSAGDGVNAANDPYKTAVVDTIVEQVQARAGDDRAVLLLGYEEEMRRMMKAVNPGLARRFQLDHPFQFPDYSDDALIRILTAKARGAGLELDLSVAKHAVASLAKARAKPNFGNAGAVENLLSGAKLRLQARPGDGKRLSLADFDITPGQDDAALDSLFDGLTGCEAAKAKLERLRDTVAFAQNRGEDLAGAVSFNWCFTGSPGTGKTTIARLMGRMFKALGLLPDDAVKEVSASDLVTGYAGQAGKKTHDALREARGGVLFIDEAYQLDPARGGSYMTEVVDELVKGLTSEEFKGRVLVILAGYKADMDRMMKNTNPGLRSRFAEQLHFEDLAPSAVETMMLSMLSQRGLSVAPGTDEGLPAIAGELSTIPEFANGRDVDQLCVRTFQQVARRCSKNPRSAAVTVGDLRAALAEMVEARRGLSHWEDLGSLPVGSRLAAQPQPQDQQQSAAPTPLQMKKETASRTRSASAMAEAECDVDEDEWVDVEEGPGAENRFAGVDTKVLRRLQTVLDEQGLNTEGGAGQLAALDPSDPEFARLQRMLVDDLGMSPAAAVEQLRKWQSAHKNMQKELQKEREKKKHGLVTQEPIWRCAVCGRADKPYIACWVAPYIVGYQPVAMAEPEGNAERQVGE